jgi:catechol 2,3-dioxygenase-like lactoylglutathione lyase family enzyme
MPARALGVNHVAIEVGDVDEALAWYGRIVTFELRGRAGSMAFVDLGDQFMAFSEGRRQAADDERHFGLVVDDREEVRRALDAAGIPVLPGRGLNFRDPWGNRVEIVQYDAIQFTKSDAVLRGMGVGALAKTEAALRELSDRGLAG